MNKKISLGAAIAFIVLVASTTFSITMIYARQTFNSRMTSLKEREVNFEKYAEIDRTVRENYLGIWDETVLMDNVAKGYLQGIGDTYGAYLDAKSYERITKNTQGQSAGIGAVIKTSPDGYLVVEEVYPESPAQIAGIQAGDLIIKLDEIDITYENSDTQLEAIQGEPGTKITLVVRSGSDETTKEITRRYVDIPTVYSRMIAESSVGYLRIKSFGDSTPDQFNREMQRMLDAGATSLIFDVRDNAGGTINSVIRILDKLLPAGRIATAVYKDGTQEVLGTSDANEISLPMVVLVNEKTASSAELFAQALKDTGKARAVGTLTVGKGVMQKMFQLDDGSVLDLTVAYIYPPSGNNFHGVGVKPDFEVALPAELEGNWANLDETLDPQLQKAVEVAATNQAAEAPAAEEPESSEEEISESESEAESEAESQASGEESEEE